MAVVAVSPRILSRHGRWLWQAWDGLAELDQPQVLRYGRTEHSARRRVALVINRRERAARERTPR